MKRILVNCFKRSDSVSRHQSTKEPITALIASTHIETDETALGAMHYNDPFPISIENIYEPRTETNTLMKAQSLDAKQASSTSSSLYRLLKLPRELRDEIYGYLFSEERVIKVRLHQHRRSPNGLRISERFPAICHAFPVLRDEILAVHYRTGSFRFSARYADSYVEFAEWIRQRGSVLTDNLRHLRISHSAGIPHTPLSYNPYVATSFISSGKDGNIDVSIAQQMNVSNCSCSLLSLVQERLCRDDAFIDSELLRRIEESTALEPLWRFAIQLLCAVRLVEASKKEAAQLSYLERSKMFERLPRLCGMCGKPKWMFRL